MQEADYRLKVLLVGETGVGKSCLLVRFVEGTFSSTFISTIGVDFKMKILDVRRKKVKLQVWDTAGQERFRTVTRSYYHGAHGVLLVFDLTDLGSFLKVKYWVEQIRTHGDPDTVVFLIGNKCDLPDKRAVDRDKAIKLSSSLGLTYVETSARENVRVNDSFHQLTEQILDSGAPLPSQPSSTDLDKKENQHDDSWCEC